MSVRKHPSPSIPLALCGLLLFLLAALRLVKKRHSAGGRDAAFVCQNECVSLAWSVGHQGVHLVDQAGEELQGLVDGLGGGHVHPGAPEQVDGRLGGAPLQEA